MKNVFVIIALTLGLFLNLGAQQTQRAPIKMYDPSTGDNAELNPFSATADEYYGKDACGVIGFHSVSAAAGAGGIYDASNTMQAGTHTVSPDACGSTLNITSDFQLNSVPVDVSLQGCGSLIRVGTGTSPSIISCSSAILIGRDQYTGAFDPCSTGPLDSIHIGDCSGNSMNGGVGNVAIGVGTMSSSNISVCGAGASSRNVVIGNDAGTLAGDRNVYIGEGAGTDNNQDGNIFIGYASGENTAFDLASHRLLIDSSTNATAPIAHLIDGDLANDELTIRGDFIVDPTSGQSACIANVISLGDACTTVTIKGAAYPPAPVVGEGGIYEGSGTIADGTIATTLGCFEITGLIKLDDNLANCNNGTLIKQPTINGAGSVDFLESQYDSGCGKGTIDLVMNSSSAGCVDQVLEFEWNVGCDSSDAIISMPTKSTTIGDETTPILRAKICGGCNTVASTLSIPRLDATGTIPMIRGEHDNGSCDINLTISQIASSGNASLDGLVFDSFNRETRLYSLDAAGTGTNLILTSCGTNDTVTLQGGGGSDTLTVGASIVGSSDTITLSDPCGVGTHTFGDANDNVQLIGNVTICGGIGGIDAACVSVPHIGSCTIAPENLEERLDDTQSTGLITGGVITIAACSGVDISTGAVMVREAADNLSPLYGADFAGVSCQALTACSLNFVYASYSTPCTPCGIAQVNVVTGAPLADVNQNVILGTVYDDTGGATGELHITNVKIPESQLNQKLAKRLVFLEGIETQAGGIISEEGINTNLTFSVSAGNYWLGLEEFSLSAFDSDASPTPDQFEYMYYNGTNWVSNLASVINHLQYNDTASGLTNLGNNRFGIHWVYLGLDGDKYVVYGQDEYNSLADAEAASTPSLLPPHFSIFHSKVVGKIITKQNNAVSFAGLQQSNGTTFAAGAATDHGNLSGLADDDHTQYSLADGTRAFTGAVSIDDTTNATSGSTGALTVDGGIGTLGDSFFEGNLEIETASFPSFKAAATTASTSGNATVFVTKRKTSGDMTDGFGANFQYRIEDDASGEQTIARISAERDGADNEGAVEFKAGTDGNEVFFKLDASSDNVQIKKTTSVEAVLNAHEGTNLYNTSSSAGGVFILADTVGGDWARLDFVGDGQSTSTSMFITQVSSGGATLNNRAGNITFNTGAGNNVLNLEDDTVTVNDIFSLGGVNNQTISSGVMTMSKSYHTIDTESAAATDDLDTINGGDIGDILVIRTSSNTRDVTVKDGSSIRLPADRVLDHTNDMLILFRKTSSIWLELSYSNNE